MVRCLKLQLVNLKLQTQFLIMISLLFTLIISFLIALNATQFKLLNSQLQENSDIIFKQKSLIIQSNVINWQKSYLEKIFFLSQNYLYVDANTLITLHRLYHATKNQVIQRSLEETKNYQMDYAGIKQIPEPIRIINGSGNNDLSYSFICYSNLSDFENPKTVDEQIGIKIQEQFQSFGQILHSDKTIDLFVFKTYVVKEKIYTNYPCTNLGEKIHGYHAEQRNWYKEAKRNYDSKILYSSYNYSFAKPYLLDTQKRIAFSISLPLVDKELKFIGGLSSTIIGKELLQSIKESNFGFQVIYLVSDEGMMIMHPYQTDDNNLKLYIYNETITGFNETDWQQIQSIKGESSCPTFAHYQSSLKCRYNSLYKQEMIVGSYIFEEFKMILILLQSSQEYVQFYKIFQSNLEIELQFEISYIMLIQVGQFIFLSFIIYKIADILFVPIRFVEVEALNLVSKQDYKQTNLPKLIQLFMSKDIQEIFQSFKLLKKKLNQLSLQKTSQCLEIEKYQFPEKFFDQQFNIQFQINKLRRISIQFQQDNIIQGGVTFRQIQNILKSLYRNCNK